MSPYPYMDFSSYYDKGNVSVFQARPLSIQRMLCIKLVGQVEATTRAFKSH